MKAQHFARNILAAAVLSALGAHAAVAADFSEGVYENHGEQDVYDNFIVKNTDGAELDNSAGVLIQKRGGMLDTEPSTSSSGLMFRPRRLTPRCSLVFVSIPKACLSCRMKLSSR